MVWMRREPSEFRHRLGAGGIRSQAGIARQEGLTPARGTQILGLLHLAPAIQEYIVAMSHTAGRPPVAEPALPRIVRIADAAQQETAFFALLGGGDVAQADDDDRRCFASVGDRGRFQPRFVPLPPTPHATVGSVARYTTGDFVPERELLKTEQGEARLVLRAYPPLNGHEHLGT